MIIPTIVRVGSTFYKVTTQDTPVVVNGLQCYGYCDPNNHTIILATDIQDEQTMEQTFCHELVHAMMFERKINLEAMGLTNAQMEHVVDSLGISLHQILLDNPDITLTDEEYDSKYPLGGDDTDAKQEETKQGKKLHEMHIPQRKKLQGRWPQRNNRLTKSL